MKRSTFVTGATIALIGAALLLSIRLSRTEPIQNVASAPVLAEQLNDEQVTVLEEKDAEKASEPVKKVELTLEQKIEQNVNNCASTRIRADNAECLEDDVVEQVERVASPVSTPPQAQGSWVDQCYAWAEQAGVVLNSSAITLLERESHCNPNAQNPVSTAYGIGQFLDTTWAGSGCVKSADPVYQLQCTNTYVVNRYGSWEGALAHSYSVGWY